MSSLETRNVARDSLFLFAELALDDELDAVKVKVRNLSAGGMMVDAGGIRASRGDRLTINLRHIGKVKGTIAWTQGTRFGIAFEREIDPKFARAPAAPDDNAPLVRRPSLSSAGFAGEPRRIRSV